MLHLRDTIQLEYNCYYSTLGLASSMVELIVLLEWVFLAKTQSPFAKTYFG